VNKAILFSLSVVATALAVSCARHADAGIDHEVATLGTVEVTAKLLEIQGPFPPNDLYNYAFVMKYKVLAVHRGKVAGDQILVAHYNPLKPRATAQDEFSGKVGGRLSAFRAGDVHRMALEEPLDNFWMGGVVDKYFNEKGVRYWAVWTNLRTD